MEESFIMQRTEAINHIEKISELIIRARAFKITKAYFPLGILLWAWDISRPPLMIPVPLPPRMEGKRSE